jgi:maleamate amidohydrolase
VHVWDDILSPLDREVISRGGYGKSRGLGDHPAFLIIDAQYNYVGENKPILDQIRQWPSGAGESAWRTVGPTAAVLETFRDLKLPVIYTRNLQQDVRFDSFAAKTNRNQLQYLIGAKGTEIVDELRPKEGELVVDKSYASAFYGTPLLSFLVKLKVDTLFVVGGTTSGCVRATCVDGASRNFDVAVLEDCVFDRVTISHKVALLDLWMKYCDVITSDEAIAHLKRARNSFS